MNLNKCQGGGDPVHKGVVCGERKTKPARDDEEGESLSCTQNGSFHHVSMVTAGRRLYHAGVCGLYSQQGVYSQQLMMVFMWPIHRNGSTVWDTTTTRGLVMMFMWPI